MGKVLTFVAFMKEFRIFRVFYFNFINMLLFGLVIN